MTSTSAIHNEDLEVLRGTTTWTVISLSHFCIPSFSFFWCIGFSLSGLQSYGPLELMATRPVTRPKRRTPREICKFQMWLRYWDTEPWRSRWYFDTFLLNFATWVLAQDTELPQKKSTKSGLRPNSEIFPWVNPCRTNVPIYARTTGWPHAADNCYGRAFSSSSESHCHIGLIFIDSERYTRLLQTRKDFSISSVLCCLGSNIGSIHTEDGELSTHHIDKLTRQIFIIVLGRATYLDACPCASVQADSDMSMHTHTETQTTPK